MEDDYVTETLEKKKWEWVEETISWAVKEGTLDLKEANAMTDDEKLHYANYVTQVDYSQPDDTEVPY